MTKTQKLYRVLVTSGTPQDRDRGQVREECVYCGYDRMEAVRVYYQYKTEDYGGDNYTGGHCYTKIQSKVISED